MPVIVAPCILLTRVIRRRVDGVVGYRICLTSVHRRSSVRAWVDSLFVHSTTNVFIRATYNWRCYVFQVLHRSQRRQNLHFSLFWFNSSTGEPSRYSQMQQTHWSQRERLLESRQGAPYLLLDFIFHWLAKRSFRLSRNICLIFVLYWTVSPTTK